MMYSVQSHSRVSLSATPWTAACQASSSIASSQSLLSIFSCVYVLLLMFSHEVMSHSLQSHEMQHARLPCPSPTLGAYSNSCPLSRWSHPTISSSDVSFASYLQLFPASGSFPMSQLFASGGQSFGVSASTSLLPMNIQDWFPLVLTNCLIYR